MTSRTGGALSIGLIVAALVAAVFIAPVGSEQDTEAPDLAPPIESTTLRAADERMLQAGRSAERVGEPTPPIAFTTFDGSPVELHERTRPVVLLFLRPPCRECEDEMSKLAVIGAVAAQDAWIAALADPDAAGVAEQAFVDAGAAGLVYAGADPGGAIGRSFGIARTPATVVLDADMRIAAVWERSVPAAVVTELIRRFMTTG